MGSSGCPLGRPFNCSFGWPSGCSSGRLSSTGQHPAGNVTGLTLIDFLALPPRARIAVTYNGEEGGEGFLSMKKL